MPDLARAPKSVYKDMLQYIDDRLMPYREYQDNIPIQLVLVILGTGIMDNNIEDWLDVMPVAGFEA
jgi:hypothetical protein